ncbi:hypothetical protein F5884DRAFT_797912 [Xylogone sp. PMI_703]|nr:hypothetical protein F5884DRAFT_797912 [Xylogone sp. PMI_703]
MDKIMFRILWTTIMALITAYPLQLPVRELAIIPQQDHLRIDTTLPSSVHENESSLQNQKLSLLHQEPTRTYTSPTNIVCIRSEDVLLGEREYSTSSVLAPQEGIDPQSLDSTGSSNRFIASKTPELPKRSGPGLHRANSGASMQVDWGILCMVLLISGIWGLN